MTASYNLSQLGSNYLQGGTGSVARTTASKLQESVSVKDFGAVGDGTTDDTAAIQAAVNAVATSGINTILFPQGKYKVTTAITPKSRMILVGTSTSATDNYDPAGSGSTIVLGDNSFINWTGVSVGRCRIENLYIDATACVSQSVIILSKTYSWQFQNLVVQNFAPTGSTVGISVSKCWDILFQRIVAAGPGSKTFLSITDASSVVEDCDLENWNTCITTGGGTVSPQPDGNPNTAVTILGGYFERVGNAINFAHGQYGSASVHGGFYNLTGSMNGVTISGPNVQVFGPIFPTSTVNGIFANNVKDHAGAFNGCGIYGVPLYNFHDPYNVLHKDPMFNGSSTVANSTRKTDSMVSATPYTVWTVYTRNSQSVAGKLRVWVYVESGSGLMWYQEFDWMYSQGAATGNLTFNATLSLSQGVGASGSTLSITATPTYASNNFVISATATLAGAYAGLVPLIRAEMQWFGYAGTSVY
jgi:hypothetical protein